MKTEKKGKSDTQRISKFGINPELISIIVQRRKEKKKLEEDLD